MDHRKDAKRLLRAFHAGDAGARRRAESVLGMHTHERFQLSDAQHVVAFEHGYRTWPELARETKREEETVDTGLEYRTGDPVRVRIVRRARRTSVDDLAGGVERAETPPGWQEVADRIAEELSVNVSRRGVVFLPLSRRGPGEQEIVRRIGEASLALFQELLEL